MVERHDRPAQGGGASSAPAIFTENQSSASRWTRLDAGGIMVLAVYADEAPDVRRATHSDAAAARARRFYACVGGPIFSGGRPNEFHTRVFKANYDPSFRRRFWANSRSIGTESSCVDFAYFSEGSGNRAATGSRGLREKRWPDTKDAYRRDPAYYYQKMTDEVIFSAVSSADFGFTEIFLTSKQADHISAGHRDIGSVVYTLVKEAVEQTTHVYTANVPKRLVYMSHNVTTTGGRPMVVVVERVEDRGKIITATWKDYMRGQVVWDSTNGIYANFDDESDVLYISRGPAVTSYASEDDNDPDIWYRYSDIGDSPTGVTIFRAKQLKGTGAAAKIASAFLGVAEDQLNERITGVMG